MVVIKWVFIAVVALVVLVLLAGQLGALQGKVPEDLGISGGKLKRPSKTPNSVSSQADAWPDHPHRDYARIAPLALVGDGPTTIAKLKRIAENTPGAKLIESKPDYLYVQFSTRVLRFVDDAEFWFDPAAGAIQVRSASRLGRKDLGVNRARVESIRAALASSR